MRRILHQPASVLPHFERASLFIEKGQSLFPANRAAIFVGQSQQMRKCAFCHHSISVLLFAA
jgi:hypothetical protein